MQPQKNILVVLVYISIAHLAVCYNATFTREKSDREESQSVSSDFESMGFTLPLQRENQTGRKAASPAGFSRPTPTASDCLSAKSGLFHTASIEPSHLTTTNGHALVSLHCLLTVWSRIQQDVDFSLN